MTSQGQQTLLGPIRPVHATWDLLSQLSPSSLSRCWKKPRNWPNYIFKGVSIANTITEIWDKKWRLEVQYRHQQTSSSLTGKWIGFEKIDLAPKTICKSLSEGQFDNLLVATHSNYQPYRKCRKWKPSVVSCPQLGKTCSKLSRNHSAIKFLAVKKSNGWQDITNDVKYYIAKDMVPIQGIDKEMFQTTLYCFGLKILLFENI